VLQHRTVAYINLDSPVLLPEVFRADGSPLLHNLLYETAKLVRTLYLHCYTYTVILTLYVVLTLSYTSLHFTLY